MDKTIFLHRLKGLGDVGCAGQALYRACTECVQIRRRGGRRRFCTVAPVDIQVLVHSRLEAASQQVEAGMKKKFSRASNAAVQVYKLRLYTRLVIVLTTALFCG